MKTFKTLHESKQLDFLNESENAKVDEIVQRLNEHKLEDLDEGLLGSIIGGVSGFLLGPSIGKVIANALGIEKGIIYDMLTSRLVTAALGAALTKYIGGGGRK